MVELLRGNAMVVAFLVFLAVAIGAVGLTLLIEWAGERRRRVAVLGELKRLTDRPLADNFSALTRGMNGEAPRWMRSLEARFPRLSDLSLMLYQAGVKETPASFILTMAGFAAAFGFIGMLVTRSLFVGIILAATGAFIPYMRIARKRAKRMGAFEEGLPEAIDLLARAIRAGHPLSSGLKMVADELADPISTEFRRTFEEQRFGVAFDDAVLSMADRVAIVDVRILVTAILIQREVGGNLAEVLDNLASVIRARFSIRRQLRTYTAQGRMTGYILAALPIVLASIIYMLNPGYMSLLWTHPMGRFMLFSAIIMQFMGYLWIRKIVNIDI
jgi:tight adherence protein B